MKRKLNDLTQDRKAKIRKMNEGEHDNTTNCEHGGDGGDTSSGVQLQDNGRDAGAETEQTPTNDDDEIDGTNKLTVGAMLPNASSHTLMESSPMLSSTNHDHQTSNPSHGNDDIHNVNVNDDGAQQKRDLLLLQRDTQVQAETNNNLITQVIESVTHQSHTLTKENIGSEKNDDISSQHNVINASDTTVSQPHELQQQQPQQQPAQSFAHTEDTKPNERVDDKHVVERLAENKVGSEEEQQRPQQQIQSPSPKESSTNHDGSDIHNVVNVVNDAGDEQKRDLLLLQQQPQQQQQHQQQSNRLDGHHVLQHNRVQSPPSQSPSHSPSPGVVQSQTHDGQHPEHDPNHNDPNASNHHNNNNNNNNNNTSIGDSNTGNRTDDEPSQNSSLSNVVASAITNTTASATTFFGDKMDVSEDTVGEDEAAKSSDNNKNNSDVLSNNNNGTPIATATPPTETTTTTTTIVDVSDAEQKSDSQQQHFKTEAKPQQQEQQQEQQSAQSLAETDVTKTNGGKTSDDDYYNDNNHRGDQCVADARGEHDDKGETKLDNRVEHSKTVGVVVQQNSHVINDTNDGSNHTNNHHHHESEEQQQQQQPLLDASHATIPSETFSPPTNMNKSNHGMTKHVVEHLAENKVGSEEQQQRPQQQIQSQSSSRSTGVVQAITMPTDTTIVDTVESSHSPSSSQKQQSATLNDDSNMDFGEDETATSKNEEVLQNKPNKADVGNGATKNEVKEQQPQQLENHAAASTAAAAANNASSSSSTAMNNSVNSMEQSINLLQSEPGGSSGGPPMMANNNKNNSKNEEEGENEKSMEDDDANIEESGWKAENNNNNDDDEDMETQVNNTESTAQQQQGMTENLGIMTPSKDPHIEEEKEGKSNTAVIGSDVDINNKTNVDDTRTSNSRTTNTTTKTTSPSSTTSNQTLSFGGDGDKMDDSEDVVVDVVVDGAETNNNKSSSTLTNLNGEKGETGENDDHMEDGLHIESNVLPQHSNKTSTTTNVNVNVDKSHSPTTGEVTVHEHNDRHFNSSSSSSSTTQITSVKSNSLCLQTVEVKNNESTVPQRLSQLAETLMRQQSSSSSSSSPPHLKPHENVRGETGDGKSTTSSVIGGHDDVFDDAVFDVDNDEEQERNKSKRSRGLLRMFLSSILISLLAFMLFIASNHHLYHTIPNAEFSPKCVIDVTGVNGAHHGELKWVDIASRLRLESQHLWHEKLPMVWERIWNKFRRTDGEVIGGKTTVTIDNNNNTTTNGNGTTPTTPDEEPVVEVKMFDVHVKFHKLPNTLNENIVFRDLDGFLQEEIGVRLVNMGATSTSRQTVISTNDDDDDSIEEEQQQEQSLLSHQHHATQLNESLIVVSYASSRLMTDIKPIPYDQYLDKYRRVLIVFSTLAQDCDNGLVKTYLEDLKDINDDFLKKQSDGRVAVTVVTWDDEHESGAPVMLRCEDTSRKVREAGEWLKQTAKEKESQLQQEEFQGAV